MFRLLRFLWLCLLGHGAEAMQRTGVEARARLAVAGGRLEQCRPQAPGSHVHTVMQNIAAPHSSMFVFRRHMQCGALIASVFLKLLTLLQS